MNIQQSARNPLERILRGFAFIAVLFAVLFSVESSSVEYPAGDVAPHGSPDGQLKAADVFLLERFIFGDITPTPLEQTIGDVAPLGNPDGVLNAADKFLLERAVLGEVVLPPVVIGPDAPVWISTPASTNENPYLLSGTAAPNTEVRLYVNGIQQKTTTSDGSGAFKIYATLEQGSNSIYITAWDGTSESAPSAAISVDFTSLAPTAVIRGETQGPVGLETFFDGTRSFDKYMRDLTYNWDFGDGTAGTGENPGHVYTTTGTYTVTLTVTADGQTSDPVTTTVTVKPTQYLYYQFNSGQTILTGDKIYIADSRNFTGNDFIVPEGASLIVEAGAELRFSYPTMLVVDGTLNVRGTSSDPVRFTRLDGNPWATYLGYDYRTAAWYGIWLSENCHATIDHAWVEGARNGIQVGYNINGVRITNSVIRYNWNSGINIYSYSGYYGYSDHSMIKNNVIEDNGAGFIFYGDAKTLVSDGNIIRNNDFGVLTSSSGGNPRPTISGNAITRHYHSYESYYANPPQEIALSAQDNWWGTTDTVLITRDISDARNDWGNTEVDYSNFRTIPLITDLELDPIYDETADNPYRVNGTAPPGSVVNVYSKSYDLDLLYLAGTATADPTGRFSADISFPEEAEYEFFARRVVNGKEVEQSDWSINSIYYTPNPWWSDVPVINWSEGDNPTLTNPQTLSVDAGRSFREVNFYVNGEFQGRAQNYNSYGSIYFPVILNVGENTVYATFSTSDGESAPSQPVTVIYQPDGNAPQFTGGTVSGNKVLSPTAEPYQITSDINVNPGSKLTIQAGSVLEFANGTRLVADGELDILGTPDSPVHLKSASPTPQDDDWYGVIVSDLPQQRRIENAVIENALSGIFFGGGSATVDKVVLQNNYYGLYISNGSTPTIANSDIRDNSVGIWIEDAASPVIYPHNSITGNLEGIVLEGSGWAGDNPSARINENNIFDNSIFDLGAATFYDAANVTLDARGNWWGIPDAAAIANQIYDGNDNPADSPLVDYQPVQPALLTAVSPLSPDLDTAVGFTNDPAYTLSGTAEPNREIRVYRNDALQGSVTSDANGAFALGVTLATGDNLLYANAVNGAEESLPYKTHTVVLDQTPPVITLTSPTDGALVNYATFVGQLDKPATVTVNGEPATVNADNSFTHVLGGLPQGSNSATIIATDRAGNSSTMNVNFTLDSTPPATPDTGQITVGTVSGGQVTVSGPAGGATEGDTVTLTNSRTGQSVQTTVAADGSYSAQIGAQAGDKIALTLSDVAGNATPSRILQVAGTAPDLGLNITFPTDGQIVDDDSVRVSGTYEGTANIGIRVNGTTAQRIGSVFCAGDIPLVAGANTLEISAVAPDGTTTTRTVTVTSNGTSTLGLTVDQEAGFAPLTVTFGVDDNTGKTLTALDYDFDNNGSVDYSTSDPAEAVSHTYTAPGCYTAVVTATASDASTFTSNRTISVQEPNDAVGEVLGVYYRMLGNLRNNDIPAALTAFAATSQGRYQALFDSLSTSLAAVVDQLGTPSEVRVSDGFAVITVVRDKNGLPVAYTVNLIRTESGLWRIEGM